MLYSERVIVLRNTRFCLELRIFVYHPQMHHPHFLFLLFPQCSFSDYFTYRFTLKVTDQSQVQHRLASVNSLTTATRKLLSWFFRAKTREECMNRGLFFFRVRPSAAVDCGQNCVKSNAFPSHIIYTCDLLSR